MHNTENTRNCVEQFNRMVNCNITMVNCQVSWVHIVAEELYGDFEDLETGVVYKGKRTAEGDEV